MLPVVESAGPATILFNYRAAPRRAAGANLGVRRNAHSVHASDLRMVIARDRAFRCYKERLLQTGTVPRRAPINILTLELIDCTRYVTSRYVALPNRKVGMPR